MVIIDRRWAYQQNPISNCKKTPNTDGKMPAQYSKRPNMRFYTFFVSSQVLSIHSMLKITMSV